MSKDATERERSGDRSRTQSLDRPSRTVDTSALKSARVTRPIAVSRRVPLLGLKFSWRASVGGDGVVPRLTGHLPTPFVKALVTLLGWTMVLG